MSEDKPPALTPAPGPMQALREMTDARIALGRAGAGQPTKVAQRFLLDHARARQAVWSPLDEVGLRAALESAGFSVEVVESRAETRADYLRRPDLGRRLGETSRSRLESLKSRADIALVVADGLSAVAVELNAAPVLAALGPKLAEAGWSASPVIVALQARVAIGDEIGTALGAKAVVMLIGERPGLSASDSLGAYITFAPEIGLPDSRRNCISNIRDGGLAPALAASQIAALLTRMMTQQTSGVSLEASEVPRLP